MNFMSGVTSFQCNSRRYPRCRTGVLYHPINVCYNTDVMIMTVLTHIVTCQSHKKRPGVPFRNALFYLALPNPVGIIKY